MTGLIAGDGDWCLSGDVADRGWLWMVVGWEMGGRGGGGGGGGGGVGEVVETVREGWFKGEERGRGGCSSAAAA